MSKKTLFYCDADGKEFNPEEGISTIAVMIPKVNEKLESQKLTFEGNFCARCSELIMQFIATLKNELK
jgi:hypothetical protein